MWHAFIEFLLSVRQALEGSGMHPALCGLVQLSLVLLGAVASYYLLHLAYRLIKKRFTSEIALALWDSRLVPRALQVAALILAGAMTWALLPDGKTKNLLLLLNKAYFFLVCALIFSALLNFVYKLGNWRRGVTASPQRGIFQMLSLIGYGFATVAMVATLLGRDPTYVLSGLTALSAVLMLVFKDSILGFTAGVTLSGNGMIRIGDWIEVPGSGADGTVIDINLTTVRVQNWDNTITTLPAYDLIAKPFKNWRGMSDSGGRRIKRSILIDLDTVRFADEAQLEHWKEIDLLRDYIAEKIHEVRAYNSDHPSSATSVANARKLTNIGTFRAYCVAYLRANAQIHKGMTLIVRLMQPTERGIPLEIYCFTTKTAWALYEQIQSDIFDHLLAIMPEFGLGCFQSASAAAMRQSPLAGPKPLLPQD